MSVLQHLNEYFTQSNREQLPKTALFLVGSNPLPLYVAAKALEPEKLLLLGTSETADVMERLKVHLDVPVVEASCDGADSVDIKRKTRVLIGEETDIWLFYTGGTKAMSLHAYDAWKAGRPEHWAAYLSPKGSRLWFNGIQKAFPLTPGNNPYEVPKPCLEEVLLLHNMALNKASDTHCQNAHLKSAENIHSYVMSNGADAYFGMLPPCHWEKAEIYVDEDGEPISWVGYEQPQEDREPFKLFAGGTIGFFNEKNFKKEACHNQFSLETWRQKIGIGDEWGVTLDEIGNSLRGGPLTGRKKKKKEKARLNTLKWMATQWLETWTANGLMLSELFHDIHDSVVFKIPEVPDNNLPEVDVCAMRGHTPFVFSCTTDAKPGLGKHKLFEVRLRADQLGGEHARAAVVCFSETPEAVEKQLKQGWQGYGTIKVFGKKHIINYEAFQKSVEEWINELEA